MTIATELARRILAFTYDGLPDAALECAKTGILDTVGVTLAGSAEPCAEIMLRVCTATGPALRGIRVRETIKEGQTVYSSEDTEAPEEGAPDDETTE